MDHGECLGGSVISVRNNLKIFKINNFNFYILNFRLGVLEAK